ncbi:MAG TPA: DegV family protein [Chloroflexota bacterium]|nr:DegV family protein [Chloroflexota bacterium]
MSQIRIVTDSTADMDEQLAAQLGIVTVPLKVHWNAETYEDKTELSLDEFYRKLREEKGTPKTSQPSVGRFVDVYRELLESAEGIVSIHISTKVSGTANAAQVAASQVAPDRIAIVDSKNLSDALGCLAIRVARLAAGGASLPDCVATAEDLVPRLRLFAAMDTLEFLRRGGRVNRMQAFAGNLLSIKPMVHLVNGEIVPVDRVRTRAASVKRMAELVAALGRLEEVAVLYGDDPRPADDLEAQLTAILPGMAVRRGRTGAVIGTHTGPGVFGASAVVARGS